MFTAWPPPVLGAELLVGVWIWLYEEAAPPVLHLQQEGVAVRLPVQGPALQEHTATLSLEN